ncbi:MAG: cytochrome c3 family protein [Humidesulfovibrio sp.]|nr:cytochrome c3 family protein [Humidesulfovibrio sp.]
MEKGRVLLLSAGTLFVLAVVSILSLEAQGVGEAQANAAARADVVQIDTMKSLGALELPPVTFLHDKHTAALAKAGKDCKACHLEKDGQLVIKFKREKDTTKAEAKAVYHQNCIGCHTDMTKKGEKTGPLDGDCRSCHDAKSQIVSARQPAGFTNALHFRHSEAKAIPSGLKGENGEVAKDNCDRCHHEFNKDTKKTFYAKGKEESCRVCHLEKPTKDTRSMSEASHAACVNCHRSLVLKGVKETGPVECAGCHSKAGQEKIALDNKAAMAKVPDDTRLIRRNQPDLTLMSVEKPVADAKPQAMSPAVFNHKLHEKSVESCRTCHHKGLQACNKCHTVAGSKEGGYVRLEQAMHQATAQQSCIGCHNQKKAEPKCAGCHDMIKARKTPPADECKKCHIQGKLNVPAEQGQMPAYWNMKPEEKTAAASALLKDRAEKADIFNVDDIPEKVSIKGMANEYEGAEMPHRKIILKLVENLKDSKMSGVFHADPGTLCQACHHHGQPGAKKPPRCENCHGKPFDASTSGRPGLKAAYHGQCMSCHKSMGLKKPLNTDCVGCHKEKKK